MIFDRISLIAIYDTLKIVQDNDGPVSEILLNKGSAYGTKTVPRFKTLADLKVFIEDMYPYQIWDLECDCGTANEALYNVLHFTVYLSGKKHAIFVNNMRLSFESAKELALNAISVKKVHALFQINEYLKMLKAGYVCFPYIETPGDYTCPCDYIEIIKNELYETLVNVEYKKTRRLDFPRINVKPTPAPCFEAPVNVLIPEYTISASSSQIEPSLLIATLNTRYVTAGTGYTWEVIPSGSQPAAASDFAGGVFPSGSGTISTYNNTLSASDTFNISVLADNTTEGDERYVIVIKVLGVQKAQKTIVINDTSEDPIVPTYQITGSNTIAEGTTNTYTITTTDVAPGTTLFWELRNSSTNQVDFATDITSPRTGQFTTSSDPSSDTIDVVVATDSAVEPNELIIIYLWDDVANISTLAPLYDDVAVSVLAGTVVTITDVVNNYCVGTTTIPDFNFENRLINLGLDSGSPDGFIDNAAICSLNGLAVNSYNISDLTGIEAFIALTSLYCHVNQLTNLDVTNSTNLSLLYCQQNDLTSLDVSNNPVLTNLQCGDNQLTTLDVSNSTNLTTLYCQSNQLTSLTLGTGIDLNNLTLIAIDNDPNLVIHVGATIGRVALAQSLFTQINGSISAGTTFAV